MKPAPVAADQSQDLASLTGLRGLAALTVVLSHCSRDGMYLAPFLDFEGAGKLGVWLFFSLSAYLLTRQFLLHGKPGDARFAVKFIIRRAFRIFPLGSLAALFSSGERIEIFPDGSYIVSRCLRAS